MEATQQEQQQTQRPHYLHQQHQSQLLSPLNFNKLAEPVAAATTYYLTKKKSLKQQSRGKGTGSAELSISNTSVTKGALHHPQFDHEMDKKKHHVTSIQDRMHSKNMKKLTMIRKQITANTNMTKNRLAVSKVPNMSQSSQLAQVRSQSVHQTSRREKQYPDQQRITAASSNRQKFLQNIWNSNHDWDSSVHTEQENDQSSGIIFQPLQITGGITIGNIKKGKQMGYGEYESTRQTNFFPNPKGRFGDVRRKFRASSQLEQTPTTMFKESHNQSFSGTLPEQPSISKEAISLKSSVFKKRMVNDNEVDDERKRSKTQRQHYREPENQSFKIMQDQDSFLELTQNSVCLTPTKIFIPTELDGKQLVNNISEIQNSRITEQSHSHMKHPQVPINEVSTMLSQTSVLTSSRLTAANRLADCAKCKKWKRINHECRNLSLRANYKDFASVLNYMEELGKIENVQKMAPELTRSLVAIKDNFKCQYAQDKSDLEAKVFQLENKLTDTKALAAKYQSDFKQLQVKYNEINDFISGSRNVTIMKDPKHQEFLKEVAITNGDIEDAMDAQCRMQYSSLDRELKELRDEVDTAHEHQNDTIKFLNTKIEVESRNAPHLLRAEEVFDRELLIQQDAVTGFMKDHFRYGEDPDVIKFDKACVTSENMISRKQPYPQAAERVMDSIARLKLINVTQVKIENSLLCQQNTELKLCISDTEYDLEKLQDKLVFFQDLDIEKVRKAQEDYSRLYQENAKTQNDYKKILNQRNAFIKEGRRFELYEEQYKQAINTTIDFNNEMLNDLEKVRFDIKCSEQNEENDALSKTVAKLIVQPCQAILTGPQPGRSNVNNTFMSHILDQRSYINQSIDMVLRVIKIAYSLNRPLLASNQALEEVFREQKQKILAQQGPKMNALISSKDKEFAEMKEKLEAELKQVNEEFKIVDKKHNQANESARRMTLELSKAKAKAKATNSKAAPGKATAIPPSASPNFATDTPAGAKKTSSKPAPKNSWFQRGKKINDKKPTSTVKKQSDVKQVEKKLSKSNVTEDLEEDSISLSKASDGSAHPSFDESNSITSSKLSAASNTQDQAEEPGKVKQTAQQKREKLATAVTVESVYDQEQSVEKEDSSPKVSSFHQAMTFAALPKPDVSKDAAADKPEADYSVLPDKPIQSKKMLLIQSTTSDGSGADSPISTLIMSARNYTPCIGQQCNNDLKSVAGNKNTESNPAHNLSDYMAIPCNKACQSRKQPEKRNEKGFQVSTEELEHALYVIQNYQQTMESESLQGQIMPSKDTTDYQKQNLELTERVHEIRELAKKFQANPSSQTIKRQYFVALKEEYGEDLERNPYAPQATQAVNQMKKNSSSQSPSHSDAHIPEKSQPFSHFSRLQSMIDDQDCCNPKTQSIKAIEIKESNHSNISADKFDRLGTKTEQNRLDHRLYFNSKPVQCELLADSPKKLKKNYVNKNTQCDIPLLMKEKNSKVKQNHSRRDGKAVSSSPVSGMYQWPNRRQKHVQEQTIFESRIFDKSNQSSQNMNGSNSTSPHKHVIESGLWIRNTLAVLPSHGVSTLESSSPLSPGESHRLTGRFKPVLQKKSVMPRKTQTDSQGNKLFERESVMLAIKTIRMEEKNQIDE